MTEHFYDPKYDPTFEQNALILLPSVVWMELKCKRPDPSAIVSGRHQLVVHRPRVAYKTFREKSRYVLTPMGQPEPPWTVIRGFIEDTYVLEAYDLPLNGNSLLMWNLEGQRRWNAGDVVTPGTCTFSLKP